MPRFQHKNWHKETSMEWLVTVIMLCAIWNAWVISDVANKLNQIAKDLEWLKNRKNMEEIARSKS